MGLRRLMQQASDTIFGRVCPVGGVKNAWKDWLPLHVAPYDTFSRSQGYIDTHERDQRSVLMYTLASLRRIFV